MRRSARRISSYEEWSWDVHEELREVACELEAERVEVARERRRLLERASDLECRRRWEPSIGSSLPASATSSSFPASAADTAGAALRSHGGLPGRPPAALSRPSCDLQRWLGCACRESADPAPSAVPVGWHGRQGPGAMTRPPVLSAAPGALLCRKPPQQMLRTGSAPSLV